MKRIDLVWSCLAFILLLIGVVVFVYTIFIFPIFLMWYMTLFQYQNWEQPQWDKSHGKWVPMLVVEISAQSLTSADIAYQNAMGVHPSKVKFLEVKKGKEVVQWSHIYASYRARHFWPPALPLYILLFLMRVANSHFWETEKSTHFFFSFSLNWEVNLKRNIKYLLTFFWKYVIIYK